MPSVVAGQIGSNQFTVFELEPTYRASIIETMKRPGTDYHAYKQQGYEFPEQELRAQQQFTTHLLARDAIVTYTSYMGTNQTLIRGSTTYGVYKFIGWPNYPKVTPPRFSPAFVGDPGGATSGFIVEVTFRVQRQS